MIGGELHGKFIILSFRDDEEALYNKVISAIYAISNFPIMAASADAPLLFGSLQIDPQRRLVWQSGQAVDLTPMEFDILLLLAYRPGQVFTARQIYEAVAVDSFDASWTGISSMVYKLRRKLGAGIIETVRGHGYNFVVPGTSLKYSKRTTDLLPLCASFISPPVMRPRHTGLLLVFVNSIGKMGNCGEAVFSSCKIRILNL